MTILPFQKHLCGCNVKTKVFSKNLENLQKKHLFQSLFFLIKLQAEAGTCIKKRPITEHFRANDSTACRERDLVGSLWRCPNYASSLSDRLHQFPFGF